MRKLSTTLLLLIIAAFSAAAISLDKIPNVHVADRTRFVSDPNGYLSPASLAKADSILSNIWKTSSAEAVAVIVDNIDGLDIDTAGTRLFEKWGIGKSDKDNGVLILISMDDRKAVIRTGYGIEGVLPDVYCARILRNIMFPNFKSGNVDNGVIESLSAISDIVTSPEAADELMSKYENDATAQKNASKPNYFRIYLTLSIIAAIAMILWLIYRYFSTRKMERHERYERFQPLTVPFLMLGVAGLGIPLIAYALLKFMMHRVRRSVPRCSNCDHKMRLIDEVHDNDYLTPAQDREEQLNSVDYDVWHCDNCQNNLILPYVNHHAAYEICPNCGARADRLESNTVVQQPTTTAEGIGAKTYVCNNCHQRRRQLYKIAKIVAAPTIIVGPGFGGRGGRGEGFGGFGGGFGGGSTGGGGASGGW